MRWMALVLLLLQWSMSAPLSWTPQERTLLAAHPLGCISTDRWAPFNTSIDGELAGIGIDYWRTITERLDLPFRCRKAASWEEVLHDIRERKSDVTIATERTEARAQYAVFSKPYVAYPYVIVTRNTVGFVYDVRMLRPHKIAVGKGYTITTILKNRYPELSRIETPSIDDALERVAQGEAYAAIDVLPVLAYKLNRKQFASLKISGMLPETFSARIMLRKDYAPLLPLINRAIDSISDAERTSISEKWIRIPSGQPPEYFRYFFLLMGGALVTALGFFIWIRRLKQQVDRQESHMKSLKEVANIDSLTGVRNRRMLDMELAQQLAIADRYRQLLSVIFFDVDHFKAINDRYGHDAGDDVLIALTHLVAGSIRKSDAFGRWGGDEFLILLPKTSQRQAKRFVEVLQQKISEHVFPGVQHVSCSFGVVAYRHDDTIRSLMKRADNELYRAKKHRPQAAAT